MRTTLALAVMTTLGLVVGPARAQSKDDLARADTLFKEGVARLKQGDDAAACSRFAESKELAPAVGVSLYLADCLQRVGKPASAWREFRSAEALAIERKDKRASLAHHRAEVLAPAARSGHHRGQRPRRIRSRDARRRRALVGRSGSADPGRPRPSRRRRAIGPGAARLRGRGRREPHDRRRSRSTRSSQRSRGAPAPSRTRRHLADLRTAPRRPAEEPAASDPGSGASGSRSASRGWPRGASASAPASGSRPRMRATSRMPGRATRRTTARRTASLFVTTPSTTRSSRRSPSASAWRRWASARSSRSRSLAAEGQPRVVVAGSRARWRRGGRQRRVLTIGVPAVSRRRRRRRSTGRCTSWSRIGPRPSARRCRS